MENMRFLNWIFFKTEGFIPLEMRHTSIHYSDMPCQYTSSTWTVHMKRLDRRTYGEVLQISVTLAHDGIFQEKEKSIIVLTFYDSKALQCILRLGNRLIFQFSIYILAVFTMDKWVSNEQSISPL